MTYIDEQITKTQALLRPRPIDPLERITAGMDDIDVPKLTPWKLTKAVLFSLFLWGVIIAAFKQLTPYIVWVMGS